VVKARISGLYAVTPDEADTRTLLRRVLAALDGGARWVQYRNKTADAGLRREQAAAIRALCAARGARLIVNDDVALALEVDADGAHMGSDDMPAAEARHHLGPGKLLGVSCYDRVDLAEAAARGGADYVALGSFFPSSVKPGAVKARPELIQEAKRLSALPVVAIGGITLENAPRLIEAGADALAVITALFGAPDVRAAARAFSGLFRISCSTSD
jgi:thiamine-phosphate pyrophosphorylase